MTAIVCVFDEAHSPITDADVVYSTFGPMHGSISKSNGEGGFYFLSVPAYGVLNAEVNVSAAGYLPCRAHRNNTRTKHVVYVANMERDPQSNFIRVYNDDEEGRLPTALRCVEKLRAFSAAYAFGTDPNSRDLSVHDRGVGSSAILWAANVINGWARGLHRVDAKTGESAEIA